MVALTSHEAESNVSNSSIKKKADKWFDITAINKSEIKQFSEQFPSNRHFIPKSKQKNGRKTRWTIATHKQGTDDNEKLWRSKCIPVQRIRTGCYKSRGKKNNLEFSPK